MNKTESAENEIRNQKSSRPTSTFPDSGPESFTQVFTALKRQERNQPSNHDGPQSGRPLHDAPEDNSLRRAENKSPQVFENPEQERSGGFPDSLRPRANDPFPVHLNRASKEGEFTQLLRRVSQQPSVGDTRFRTPVQSTRAGDLSEFTQVVSQSMARETDRQSGNLDSPDHTEQASSRQSDTHCSTPPVNRQTIVSDAHEVSRMAGVEEPLNSHVADHVRTALSKHSRALASAPNPHNPTENRLQEYVPVLLIANLFLTVLLLLLFGFAFLRH